MLRTMPKGRVRRLRSGGMGGAPLLFHAHLGLVGHGGSLSPILSLCFNEAEGVIICRDIKGEVDTNQGLRLVHSHRCTEVARHGQNGGQQAQLDQGGRKATGVREGELYGMVLNATGSGG